jgi:acetate---CoA ligase (ADP-forming) subunit beta
MITPSLLNQVRQEKRTILTEVESKAFLESLGLPVVTTQAVSTREEALRIASGIGFPVAMKILSPDIIHKSDCGGVCLGIGDTDGAEKAFDDIIARARTHHPEARIQGVAVQKMAPAGQEVIIGMSKDAQFGPLLMFGLGGIMVELLKDVSFRIVPLSAMDARDMIAGIKGHGLLTGFRGSPPVDIPFLESMLLTLSGAIEAHQEIKELDLNPVIAYNHGALIVDARIILEDENP